MVQWTGDRDDDLRFIEPRRPMQNGRVQRSNGGFSSEFSTRIGMSWLGLQPEHLYHLVRGDALQRSGPLVWPTSGTLPR
jgi:hypothetical protein